MLKEDGEDEEGFIVPDDYLSASELNLTQSEGSQVEAELQERRKQIGKRYSKDLPQNLQTYTFILSENSDRGTINYF